MANFNLIAKLLILAIFCCLVFSQQQFTGSMTISNDPSMGQGSLITVNPIYFDSINGLMRLDFPNLVDGSGKKGFTEIYNFNNNTVYQLCNVCTVYTNPLPVPKYFREQTDIEAPLSTNKLPFIINGETCSPYQRIIPQMVELFMFG